MRSMIRINSRGDSPDTTVLTDNEDIFVLAHDVIVYFPAAVTMALAALLAGFAPPEQLAHDNRL